MGALRLDAGHARGMGSEQQAHTDGLPHFRESGILPSVKRIAVCSVGELFGGVERHILGILSGLRTRSVVPMLLLFYDGELAAQAREQGIEPVIFRNSNWSALSTARQLARILEQRHIGVVHVHGYKAMVFCALARRWYAFAMVKTEHGLPEPMAGRPMQALRERLYRFLDRTATRASSATVCYVTEELLAYYRHAHSGLQAIVIPNGVAIMDRNQLRPPPQFQNDRFKMVMVGRLDTVKGHHFAIEALAVEDQPPDVDLYIIGRGPCELELRKLAKARGVAHRVHFLGFQRNVYDYIAHCDTLLIPSLHEGLPYTLLEAMALGTPIIASRVGGLAEVLQDGVSGLLIQKGNATALARAIVRLYGDPELRRQLGGHAQRLQQARYSLEAMTERYLGVYRKLLLRGN